MNDLTSQNPCPEGSRQGVRRAIGRLAFRSRKIPTSKAMLELFLIILGILIPLALLAKRGRGRRSMVGYLKGNVDEVLSLGTLASLTLVADTWDESPEEKTLISSIVCTWTLDQLTSPQGPIIFGVAHSDYSDAEIEAVIENVASWDQGSKVEQEIAKRLVRQIGVFVSDVGTTGPLTDVVWNDGRPMKTKLNWRLNTGDTLKMWAYNTSGTALSTTVPSMRCHGHANLWQ